MKKMMILLLSFLLLCSISITAFAEEATITANVPDSHTVTVTAEGAEVFCNGQEDSRFIVDRLSEPTVLIRAESGKEITQVLLNSEDITSQIKGGYYTFAPVYENQVLTVTTKDTPAPQGKTYIVKGTVKRSGDPVEGITLELRSTLKTDVTDKDGTFTFEDVACGKHSLTAMENGKIVGYTEFVLNEGCTVDFHLADNGVYAVTADQNEVGIDLTLNLKDDSTMSIVNVTGVQASENPGGGNQGDTSGPQTGDSTNLLIWLVLILIAFAGFMATFAYSRKKKTGK